MNQPDDYVVNPWRRGSPFPDAKLEALIDEAIGTCEPENVDLKATEYTRSILRRKFRAILER